ncbi:MAG: CPBP family intramembrane metalloprotease [Chitinophagaceae bacterium]|nr:CPBP family intramembrane metalloprotease [Chitinophagaceae bacterium]
MEYKSVKGYNGWGQIGFLLLFTGVGFIIAVLLQGVMGMSMVPKGTAFDQLPGAMLKAMSDPANVNAIRMMQVLSTLLMLALPAYAFMRLCHSKHWLWLGFSKYLSPVQVLLGIVIIFCTSMLAQPLADFSKWILSYSPSWTASAINMEKMYNEQVLLMSNLTGWGEFFVGLIIMAFFPALFEEMFFRGAVQSTLHRWWKNPWAAIIVTSLLFSLIHLSIYLFLSRALLGVALGWLFYKSRNVWLGVLIHFINNTFALSQVFYLKRTGGKVNVSDMDTNPEWWGLLISAAVLIGAVILFERVSKKNANVIALKEETLTAQLNPFGNIASSSNQNLYS